MITALQIVEAVRELVSHNLPQLQRIYTDLVPEGCERPCMLVQVGPQDAKDASALLLSRKCSLTLALFDVTDDYSRTSTEGLLELQQQVLELFSCSFLQVDDRALHLKAVGGGRELDKAFVDVQVEWFEQRPARGDAMPPMGELGVTVALKEGGA